MKIVIVGVGRVGTTLIQNFADENHSLVAIDTDVKSVDNVVNRYDVRGLVGSGCEREVLIDAEADKADFFVACTSRDELNIICCSLAKKLGAKHTVARVRDPEYFRQMDNMKDALGLDLAFNPEYRTAVEISQILKFPSAKSVETFSGTDVRMVAFDVTEGNPVIGKSVMEIIKEYQSKILFAVVKRGTEVLIPRGDFVFAEDDILHIFGTETEIISFCKKLHIFKPRAKSVFIVGGGKIAYYLAQMLTKSGVSVKILEQDEARCNELSIDIPAATVLCGDGTDQQILKEEGLNKSDACITLTGLDEQNIVISLYATQQGLNKVITKVDRHSILEMVEQLGLDTALCPRDIIANHIIRFVRSHQADAEAGINTFYKIHDEVEVVEFNACKSFSKLGVPLKELSLKEGILIAGVIRADKFILPDGATTFEDGDRVLVVAAEKRINELSQILA